MTLDPQIAMVLERMSAAPLPKINTMSPAEARKMFEMTSLVLDAKNVPIGATEDRKIPGPGGEIPVRIYTPAENGSGTLPALVFFHGGGFVIGGLATHDAPCRLLANAAGCRVVSVDYRLAPEHKFPAAVDDSLAALRWVADNAAALGIDSARIAVGGDSAGGNLSAVVSRLAAKEGAPEVRFQLLIYPVTDATGETESMRAFSQGYFLEREMMDWFFAQYAAGADRSDPRLSPLLADDLAGLPPAMVVTAGYDPLRDEGAAYAAKLKAAGVSVEYVNHPGMIHGFLNMSGMVPSAGAAIDAMAAALKKALA